MPSDDHTTTRPGGNDRAPTLTGEIEPPRLGPRFSRRPPGDVRVGVLSAVRRHWFLTAVPVVLLVAAALAVGLSREPTYEAQVRLSVGRIDVSSPGALAGYALATQSLSDAYSRSIDASGVAEPVARELGLKPGQVVSRISATPIPESPVFRVQAEGPSKQEAIDLANASSTQLIRYITDLNRNNPDSKRLFASFREASTLLTQRISQQQLARERYVENKTASTRTRFETAKANTLAADLEVDTLRTAYQASKQGQASAANIQRLTPATSASSDRGSVLQILLFTAFVTGLVAGIALATLRANAVARRSQAA